MSAAPTTSTTSGAGRSSSPEVPELERRPPWLSGVHSPLLARAVEAGAHVGLLVQPKTGRYVRELGRYPAWAADNGRFSPAGAPVPIPTWWGWLEQVAELRPMFATAPDVVHMTPAGPVGDAVATWELAAPWLERIRSLEVPAALVAQDGLTLETVDELAPWSAWDCLFIGGSDAYKLGRPAGELALEARARGKAVHVGRVNSGKRLRYAASIGAHTSDGTFLQRAGGPDGVRRVLDWLASLEPAPTAQLALELAG